MRLSKRIAMGVLAVMLALSMSACGGSGNPPEQNPGSSGTGDSSISTGENSGTGTEDKKDDPATPPKGDADSDHKNDLPTEEPEKPGADQEDPPQPETPAKPASWEETWTYKYFQPFHQFPEGFRMEFGLISEELEDYSELYVYDRATNRGYMKVQMKVDGERMTTEEIILYNEPVKDVGYMGYMLLDEPEEAGEKRMAIKMPLQVAEVIEIEPSSEAFDTLTVDEDYKLALNQKVYHAESMSMDYDGKTFAGEPGEHGSGKAVFTYCYDKTTGALAYIVTPKETIRLDSLSKNFDRKLVQYEQYEIVLMAGTQKN